MLGNKSNKFKMNYTCLSFLSATLFKLQTRHSDKENKYYINNNFFKNYFNEDVKALNIAICQL